MLLSIIKYLLYAIDKLIHPICEELSLELVVLDIRKRSLGQNYSLCHLELHPEAPRSEIHTINSRRCLPSAYISILGSKSLVHAHIVYN